MPRADVDQLYLSAPEPYLRLTSGRACVVNHAFTMLTGRGIQAGVFFSFQDLFHPDDRNRATASLARIGDGGQWASVTARCYSAQGTYRWVEWRLTRIDASIVALGRDVTEHREAADRQRLLQASFQLGEEALGLGHWSFEPVNDCGAWSPGMYRLYHRDPADGVPPMEEFVANHVHPEDVAAFVERQLAAVTNRIPVELSFRTHPDRGEVRHLDNYFASFEEVDGQLTRVTGVLVDRTAAFLAAEEQQRFQATLQQTQRLESLGVLAGGIAHDFNNLLVPVLAGLEMASDTLPPGAERDLVKDATEAAHHAGSLCRDILVYAGRQTSEQTATHLSEVVRAMERLLRSSLPGSIEYTADLAAGLAPCHAEPGQVSQVAMNFVLNAAEAIGDRGGSIVVSTGACTLGELSPETWTITATQRDGGPEADAPHVYLEVTDSGAGMDQATQQRILEPFYSSKGTGRGLGLASVFGILRASQGTVAYRSRPGAGTTARALWPTVTDQKVGTRVTPAPESVAPTRRLRVLLVDDEDVVRRSVAAMLRRQFDEVVAVASGPCALDEVTLRGSGAFDAAVVDMTMPETSGRETIARLRDLGFEAPILAVSGYSAEDVAQGALAQGPVGFLGKPFTLQQLRNALSALLGP